MATILRNLLRSSGSGLGNAASRAAGATAGGLIAGEAAKEEAQKRAEAADKAKTSPIAKTEAGTKSQTKKCEMCPPDCGSVSVRSTAGWPAVSIAYQTRICGLPSSPGFITEWEFNVVTFDGFDSAQCLLKEAKASYDQFFDEYYQPVEWWARSKSGELGMIRQARSQYLAAVPHPPVRLRWYFMQPVSFAHFTGVFAVHFPTIETELQA